MTRRKGRKQAESPGPGRTTDSTTAPDADAAIQEREARIDEILEESFPASDPPAWSSVHAPDVTSEPDDGRPADP